MRGKALFLNNAVLPPTPDFHDSSLLVGITTTVPVEIILAAGLQPVDLNNIFISHPRPLSLVERAERHGFPRTTCCWIKGIFGAAAANGIETLIGVIQGDCSNTHGLMESVQFEGGRTIPFNFPYDRSENEMRRSLEKLAAVLGTTLKAADAVRDELQPIRDKLCRLDELTWRENKVTGFENHIWLVSASDFCGDPAGFDSALSGFLEIARERQPIRYRHRIAYFGVPPICPEIYDLLAMHGVHVVLNETQRQFAMPAPARNLVEQYVAYTYPYGVFPRIADLKRQIELRSASAVLHYVQSFCFRQIEDHIVRKSIPVRTLTIECDRPGPLDGQTRTRIEAFAETL